VVQCGGRRGEKSVTDTARRLHPGLEAVLGGAIVTDAAWSIRRADRAAVRLLGYHREKDLAGRNAIELIAEKDRDRIVRQTRRAMQADGAVSTECAVVRRDGTECAADLSIAALGDEQGRPTGFVAVISDSTSRRQTDSLATESEKRYRDLFESRLDGMVVIGADLKILLANQAVADIFGFDSPEELLEVDLFDYVPPEDSERVLEIMTEDMFEDDLRQTNEFRVFKKSGEEIWVSAIGVLTEYQGRPAGVASVRDITRRKRTEEVMRYQEHFFRSLIENSSDVFTIIGADGKLRYFSPSYERVLGHVLESRIGGNMLDNIYPEDFDGVVAAWRSLLSEPGSILNTQLRVRHRDGSWRYLEATARNLLDDPVVDGVVAVFRDITERKQAEEALCESESRYRSIVELCPDGIVVVDESGIVTSCNRAFAAGTGYDVQELVGRHFADMPTVSNPQDTSRYRELFRAVAAGERFASFELSWTCKDGTVRTGETHAAAMMVDGEFRGIQAVIRDTTERAMAERLVRESEEKYRSLVDRANDGIVIVQGTVLRFVNRRAAEMLGYREEELLGTDFRRTIAPEYIDEIVDRYRRRLGGEDVPSIYETVLIARDGERIDVETNVALIHYQGEPSVLTLLRDISERKRVEKAMRDLSHRLVRMQEDERRSIARELHDQTGQMLTYLSLLLDKCTLLPSGDIAGTLREAKDVVGNVIGQVRNLALGLRPSTLDSLGLLPTLLWHFEQYTSQTQIQVGFTHSGLAGNLPPEVSIAAYRIVQEALTNVARHAGVREVTVRGRADAEALELQIEDRGPGFLPGQVRASGGLGIMHERVTLLGGSLVVESTPGAGTRITAVLPLSGHSRTRQER